MALPSILQGEDPGFVETAEAFDRIDPAVDQTEYVEFLDRARVAARVGLASEMEPTISE